VRERKIGTELDCFANDVSFGKFDQRGVNVEASAFNSSFCSKIGDGLKCFDEFKPAIWIPAVVDRVYAQENVTGWNDFRPRKRVREKDRVARGNICDWNSVPDFGFRTLLRHVNIVRERGAAEDAQVDFCDAMLFYA
jgi:hypothetical protein